MIYIVFAVFLFLVAPLVIIYFIARKQFYLLLVRTSPDKWSRECSAPDDPEQPAMYADGLEWDRTNSDYAEDVSVVSDGFRLCGRYFDFGKDRAVIIVAGRTEGCLYSCYFAPPYKEAGFNVLVIDNRSHGLSEGLYNSLGLKEYRDILAWGKFLHDEKHNGEVVCHGICIGSAASLYALTDGNCPSYMDAMTADGMYTTFGASFREHLIQDKRPVFPFMRLFFRIVRRETGVNAFSYGPENRIAGMNKRILFIHSREDLYSLPGKTYSMYEKCPSKDKKFVFFDKGRHSFVRYNNTEGYDKAIKDFFR